jgi:hypothetical protein
MATATTVVGDKEGNGNGGKSNCNGNKGGWQATATRVIARRVAGNDKGGSHGNGNNVGDGHGNKAGR